jgi:hypothetical protein
VLAYKDDNGRWHDWHLGESLPEVPRVWTIQVDGHELDMVLLAMQKATIVGGGRVGFTKKASPPARSPFADFDIDED